jgi:hypothetical protein
MSAISVLCLCAASAMHAQQKQRLNPVIELLEQGKPVFGVYAPSPFPPGRRGAAPPPGTAAKPASELAK